MLCQFSFNNICQNTSKENFNIYNTTNGITTLRKHVYANHYMIAKIFEKYINNLLKKLHERKPAKKRPHVNGTIICNFFVAKGFYRKDDVQWK